MAVRDFAIVLIDELLKDKELALTDQDIRFMTKVPQRKQTRTWTTISGGKTRGISTRNPTSFAAAS